MPIRTFLPWMLLAALAPAQQPAANLLPEPSAADLQSAIERTRKEAEEEEKAWAEEQAREADAEKKRRERYDAFQKERLDIQKAIEETDRQVNERVAALDRLKDRSANLDNQVKFLRGVVLEKARHFETLVRKGFPYRTEKRLETAQLLIDDLVKERISPEEGFNRLWVLYQSEEGIASDAEIYSGTATLDNNETVPVKYMRVGKQILAYTTPAGDKLGVLRPLPDGSWQWVREGAMDFKMRQVVKDAIATAEGKAVPGFVEFPIWPAAFKPVQTPADTVLKDGPKSATKTVASAKKEKAQ